MSRPSTRAQRAAIKLRAAEKLLDDFAAGRFGKHKYSEQWIDEIGDGLAEIAKTIDPQSKSLIEGGEGEAL